MFFFPTLPPALRSLSHTRARSLFITLIAHEGEDIVIQGIICLIGAISHPALSCQMATLPWRLPVFTVTCHGRDLPATQGLERRGVDNISVPVWRFGASLLSSLLLPPALLVFLRRSPRAPSLPASFFDRHWLIEREGCSLLIGCDSSVLPEVGVPPHAVSFHGEITALCRRKKEKKKKAQAAITRAARQKRQMNFCGWKERGKPTLCAVPAFIEIQQGFIFIYFI